MNIVPARLLRRGRSDDVPRPLASLILRDPPAYTPMGATFEPDSIEIVTRSQIEAVSTLKELDDLTDGALMTFMQDAQLEYARRKRPFTRIMFGVYFMAAVVSQYFSGGTILVSRSSSFIVWTVILMLMGFAVTVESLMTWRSSKFPFAALAAVPAYYAILRADIADFSHLAKPDRKLLKRIEQTARWIERVPNGLVGFPRRSARGPIAKLAYERAAYMRSLKLHVLLPTPQSRSDFLQEMSEVVRVVITEGWQKLPAVDPHIDRVLSRVQRLGLFGVAAALLAALVTSFLWSKYLGSASSIVTLALGLLLVSVFSRLGIAIANLSQASGVANIGRSS